MPRPLVLIADDHVAVRLLLVDAMSAAGFETMAVEDGGAALDAAILHRPQVLLLDAQMPVMNGYEVLGRLKQDPQLCDIGVIMLTASGDTEGGLEALRLGAAHYATKPFSLGELIARVSRLTMPTPIAQPIASVA
ncbi:response regulator [Phenylobacterium deserti]|uniref:Response regulator n=1 Tax=Phenylobacterium deserti TaxID=1914756 RepID=A0A328AWE2_9CAUL|nr:response regulator [Phenylobacterium deserti]RAK57894.1 response regulator [Phenylobacterium deserti]